MMGETVGMATCAGSMILQGLVGFAVGTPEPGTVPRPVCAMFITIDQGDREAKK